MRDRFPTLIALGLLIALVLGTWWAADYAQRAIPIDPPRRVTHEPDAWAERFVMLRSDASGKPINRLEGALLQHYPDDDSYEITEPRAVGQQAGNPVTIGTSRKAYMDQDGARIIMREDAHLHRMADGERAAMDVRSEEIIILPDEDLAYTDKPAQVVNGRSRMNGTGMRYNNRTRQLDVHSATDVQISGADSGPISGRRRLNDNPTP
ncbi:LPS export ABC transporter periplasmic protein LptC [Orrella sp. JC864]|uniref:LPS export ABC transporter periplasmic protein LptC n=1 Tax=Orrella sp. JC864 TaxID=3120298 RepID=UPI00300BBBBA